MRTLNRLRKALITFVIVTWYIIWMDMISLIEETFDKDTKTCNHHLFSGSVEWLNNFVWIISRFMENGAAVLLVVQMFYKRKMRQRTKSMRGSVERKLYEVYGSDCDDLLESFAPSIAEQDEVNQSIDGSMSNDFTN